MTRADWTILDWIGPTYLEWTRAEQRPKEKAQL